MIQHGHPHGYPYEYPCKWCPLTFFLGYPHISARTSVSNYPCYGQLDQGPFYVHQTSDKCSSLLRSFPLFGIRIKWSGVLQARAKLPKKRRRVLPVEPTRPVRLPGQGPPPPGAPGCQGGGPGCERGQGGPGGAAMGAGCGGQGGGGGAMPQNRRMNAIKSNHPKDMMGPIMGKISCPHSLLSISTQLCKIFFCREFSYVPFPRSLCIFF